MRAWIQRFRHFGTRHQVELSEGLRDGFVVAIFFVLMIFGLSCIPHVDDHRNVILGLYVIVGSLGVATLAWKLWGSGRRRR